MRCLTLLAFLCALSAVAQPQPTTKPSATTKPLKGMAAPPPDQLMNSMLKPKTDNGRGPIQPLPDPPHVDPATGKIVPPNPPTPTLKREGSFVTADCRMQKTPDGLSFQLVFESDGKTLADPPMTILPNQTLASMELLVEGINRDPKFHVSGMVTEYKGKNFILIEHATVVADATQQF